MQSGSRRKVPVSDFRSLADFKTPYLVVLMDLADTLRLGVLLPCPPVTRVEEASEAAMRLSYRRRQRKGLLTTRLVRSPLWVDGRGPRVGY